MSGTYLQDRRDLGASPPSLALKTFSFNALLGLFCSLHLFYASAGSKAAVYSPWELSKGQTLLSSSVLVPGLAGQHLGLSPAALAALTSPSCPEPGSALQALEAG